MGEHRINIDSKLSRRRTENTPRARVDVKNKNKKKNRFHIPVRSHSIACAGMPELVVPRQAEAGHLSETQSNCQYRTRHERLVGRLQAAGVDDDGEEEQQQQEEQERETDLDADQDADQDPAVAVSLQRHWQSGRRNRSGAKLERWMAVGWRRSSG